MNTFAITGKDTLVINDRVFADLADGDTSAITFPNDLLALKSGKDGNSIYARNATGDNAEMVLRVIKGSSDDKFLNSLLIQCRKDLPSFSLLVGSFVKKIGDGEGNVTSENFNLAGGAFRTNVDSKENVEGDTEQGVSIYNLIFARAERALA